MGNNVEKNATRSDRKKMDVMLRGAAIGAGLAVIAVGAADTAQLREIPAKVVSSISVYVGPEIVRNRLHGAVVNRNVNIRYIQSTEFKEEITNDFNTAAPNMTFVIVHIAGSQPGERIKVMAGNKNLVVEQTGRTVFRPGEEVKIILGNKKWYGEIARVVPK